jgi:hypothetical protein
MLTRAGSKTGFLTAAALSLLAIGCRKETLADQAQVGAAVGEVMASADESAQSGSGTAMLPALPILRMPDQLRGPLWRRALGAIEPSASAASCYPFAFSACTVGVRSETFSDCTFGAATVDGSVTLTFTDGAACTLSSAGESVNRTADFTVTGPYGGTLTVTSPGGGQTLTRTSDGFTFAVPGMERVLTGAGGRTLFDISTATSTPLTITGSSRADFVIVSGTLVVTHNLAHYAVSLTANDLAWTPTCNCASSGTLTGMVTSGADTGKTASVAITGCGTADVTIDGETDSVTMDPCTAI